MKKRTVMLVGTMLCSLLLTATAAAQLTAPTTPGVDPGSRKSNKRASESAMATGNGKAIEGLRLAEKAIQADAKNPWAYYNKADALARLNRVDEAVTAYQEAGRRFSRADAYGKSIALYGRANVLDQAGRCQEARDAYGEYARFIRTDDPKAAAMAERFADDCGVRPAPAPAR